MQDQQAAGIGNPYVCGGGVNVIANPSGGQTDSEVLTSNRAGGIGIVHAPPHVVPVETSSSNNETVTVTEAPPVTELVTESPLENGLSASNIGVIGGNKIHFPPPSLPSKLLYSLHSSFLSMLVRAYGHFSLLTKDFLDDVRSSTDYIVVPCSIKYEPGENCVVWLCYCSISITRMGVVAKKKKKRRPCSYIPPIPAAAAAVLVEAGTIIIMDVYERRSEQKTQPKMNWRDISQAWNPLVGYYYCSVLLRSQYQSHSESSRVCTPIGNLDILVGCVLE